MIISPTESEKSLNHKLGVLHGGVKTIQPLLEKRAVKANSLLRNYVSTASEQERKETMDEKKRSKDAATKKKKDASFIILVLTILIVLILFINWIISQVQRDTGNKTREKHNTVQKLMEQAEKTENLRHQPLGVEDLKKILEERDKEIDELRKATQSSLGTY